MYTLYFQQIKESPYFKYVANKSTFPDFMLGTTYDMWQMQSLWEKGYRVVVQPAEPLLVDSDIQMFYAKGYRGPDSKPVADFESDINAWTGLGDDEVPNSESAENTENTEYAEYAKFIAYANGQEPDWCSEDFGHGKHDKQVIPDKSAKSDEVAQNANNQSSPTPRIGPLPPQAALAPIYAYNGVSPTPAEKEAEALKAANAEIAYTVYWHEPELSWWQKLKNWCNTDF